MESAACSPKHLCAAAHNRFGRNPAGKGRDYWVARHAVKQRSWRNSTISPRRPGRARATVTARVCSVSDLDSAMARLRAAERERRAAVEDLIRLGAIRSHVLVGDLAASQRTASDANCGSRNATLPSARSSSGRQIAREGPRCSATSRWIQASRSAAIVDHGRRCSSSIMTATSPASVRRHRRRRTSAIADDASCPRLRLGRDPAGGGAAPG
jgi:hypothetical protein